MDWVKVFLKSSLKRRKQFKLKNNRVEVPKFRTNRKHRLFSKQQVYDYLQERYIINLTQLERYEKSDNECPSYYFVKKYWGSFKGYRESIGVKLYKRKLMDDERILRFIGEFNIKTAKRWQELRKQYPDTHPSIKHIRRRFGSWKMARRLAMALYGKGEIVMRFIRLKKELGRMPRSKDCKGIVDYKNLMPLQDLQWLTRIIQKYVGLDAVR